MSKNIPKNEEKILSFWKKNNIFKKSIEIRPENRPYVFYDGPPFATGLPHYGHIVASLMKDIVPRYWTMKGFRVDRKWGWDCHGLPIENIIEKKLNLKSKLEIENYGIDKFNNACHATVLKYAEEWKRVIDRIGRWVDMENDYKTMDIEYMESVWWVFSELWKKDLIYQGHKAMHVCPRCETPLSNFEVTQGYKDVKDISVTAKFKLKDAKKLELEGDVFVLAWTTTPWTLPGNVLLAIGKNIKYQVLSIKGETGLYIIAKDRVASVTKDKEPKIEKDLKGTTLIGLEYEPLFPYFKNTEKAFRIVPADFVTTEEGTGVVHIAPAFGEDDYELGMREGVSFVQHVEMDGKFTKDVKDFSGMEVKPKEYPQKTDLEILKWLAKENKIFSKEKYEHSYPHCWRCDSPLINYATSSWFIKVTELKSDLLKNNKKIHWVPEHIKEGRFGKWLEGARDWAVSRNRFWGAPLPIWQSEDDDTICIGSVKELEKLSGKKITDIHKHLIDKIIIKRGSKEYKKVPEVLDCWFESGSMPYGQMHYPFENKKKFEAGFPSEFIAEGQDQTRGWFYTLHVLATALTCGSTPSIPVKTSEPAFKNVIVNGIVLAEDGKKMSKRLQNYPDPMEVISKYGADAMRYYLATSPVMYAENLNFSEVGVREMYNKLLNALFNILELYLMYGNKKEIYTDSQNILDKWIVVKLKQLGQEVEKNMNEYKLAEASRPIVDFVNDLSGWHVRRSRDRIKEKNNEALSTLRYVLLELAKICAPFVPFVAEHLHQELKGTEESVHLANWPEYGKLSKEDTTLIKDMQATRDIVEIALSLRSEAGIKVRQPLSELQVINCKLHDELLNIIAGEINIKKVTAVDKLPKGGSWVQKENTTLNIELTEELKEEGYVRELIRGINALRKSAGLTPKDKITLYIDSSKKIKNIIEKERSNLMSSTVSKNISFSKKTLKNNADINLDGDTVWIGLEK
ncbi:MAG: isoleucine--tRNA ligase [Parcubacteria group bacterium CG10_big_fil_rev_8_21_14_0_10_36_14]|nr:MAG: isoleucine--tRNA ligase [Parcubacteria group bacterium CG10_big_fil_rev_8_21_14_0_10_36_14]